jgi:hypothetical protein
MKVAMPAVVTCALAAVNTSMWASDDRRDQDRGCTNQTLSGDYGFMNEGLLDLPGGGQATLRGVVLEHFDGNGHLTTADHTVIGGMPPPDAWRPGGGTYNVNPDCTGTQTIIIPSSPAPPLVLYFVVVRQGREIRQVVEGNAITSIGKKVR